MYKNFQVTSIELGCRGDFAIMGEHPDLKLKQNDFNKDEVGADVACKILEISTASKQMEGGDEEKSVTDNLVTESTNGDQSELGYAEQQLVGEVEQQLVGDVEEAEVVCDQLTRAGTADGDSEEPEVDNRLSKCNKGDDEDEPMVGNRLTKSAKLDEEEEPVVGNRLTKSASWFNSLSRRASRKTPLKKRSFPGFRSQVQFVLGKNTIVSSST